MSGFRNISVRGKMILCIAICLIFTVTAAVLAVGGIRAVGDSYNTTIDHPLTLQRQLLARGN